MVKAVKLRNASWYMEKRTSRKTSKKYKKRFRQKRLGVAFANNAPSENSLRRSLRNEDARKKSARPYLERTSALSFGCGSRKN